MKAPLIKLLLILSTSSLLLTVNSAFTEESTANDAAKPLPASDFYQMQSMRNAQVSPDGNFIVALKNIEDTTAIVTINMNTGESFYPAKTDNKKFKFNWIRWANNDRILVSLRYIMNEDVPGVSFYETRLISMDAKKASTMINMVKPPVYNGATTYGGIQPGQFQDKVLGSVPNDQNNVYMGIDLEIQGRPGVYKVNINSAKASLVKKADSRISQWVLDAQGIARAGSGYNDDDRKVSIRVLDPTTNKWVTAWEYVVLDEPEISVLGFGKNPAEMYMLADHNGRQALFKVDLSKEGYPKELILSDEKRDIEGDLIYSKELNDVVGIYYNDGEDKSIFWQNDYKKFQLGLNKALPGASNYITSLSDDGRKYTLFSTDGISPGTIYYGNRDTKQLVAVAAPFPNLTDDVLVKKELLNYKARDGLELDGYLSRPKNNKDKPIATIILPHGGPMAEDGAGFDSFSSFLTNRGYAVFQPNFRGSSGRGHEFMIKAVASMGLAMQDDLEDAAQFLISKKIADPQKMCIVGASYGGYAALMGATKTPDLFKCAISFAGISDIKKLRGISRYTGNKNTMREQLGNDMDQLKNTSPINMVDKIQIPILLIHGSKDASVPVEQSRIMADELKSQHKVYQYIELDGGSHHLDTLQDRKQTFEAMETFLKKYLPAS